MISIRRIRTGESELYRRMRLASLSEAPYAFSSTRESALGRSAESWREQADGSARGSDRATFLAFSEGAPAGIAALYRLPDEAGAGEVIQVWIDPEHRRKHVGWELLKTVFAWGRENGFRRIKAKVTRGNIGALKFYEAFGFNAVEEDPGDDAAEIVLLREVETE